MSGDTLTRLVRRRAHGARRIELPEGAVHLWLLPEALVRDACERLGHTLTDDEVQRAVRYRQQRDRERFVARRGVLRALLGAYLRCDPASLRFTTGNGGKPALTGCGARALHFSVSQTDGLAAIACSKGHEAGVDVERTVGSGEALHIGGEILSAAERENLRRRADPTDTRMLLRIWTRKEALLKAVGTGLGGTPSAWSVVDDTDADKACWHASYRGTALCGWTLRDVDVGEAFFAALAIPCRDVAISVIDWDGSLADAKR